MDKLKIINKIIEKKEFSQLPKEDVERAFEQFDNDRYLDEEKIKLTRDLLRRVFSVFASRKLLNLNEKSAEYILKKHLSTKERLLYYKELYSRILKNLNKPLNVFDLGAGVNGFSYNYFPDKINYFGIEAIGQLVNLMNNYFKKEKLNARAIHCSLFDVEKIKKLIKSKEGNKVVFLFKTLDSLEMLEHDYSKKLLLDLTSLVDRVVISFATKSLIKRKKFKVQRNWIVDFLKKEFEIIDDFELGDEKYILFKNKTC